MSRIENPLPEPAATVVPHARRVATATLHRAALLGLALLALTVTPRVLRAQGWQQTEFVIGSCSDPLAVDSDFQLARACYFNLLTRAPFCCTDGTGSNYDAMTFGSQYGMHVTVTDAAFTTTERQVLPDFDPVAAADMFTRYDTQGGDALTPAQNDAMWGYNLGDEPGWSDHNSDVLKTWAAAMHANDAARNDGHLRAAYVNFQPGYIGSGYPSYAAAVNGFLTDPDPSRSLDAVSTEGYMFGGTTNNPTYADVSYYSDMKALRDGMGSRPFWMISYVGMDADQPTSPSPDARQLRFMAFQPVAAGARGILWFLYRFSSPSAQQDPVVRFGIAPSDHYRDLKPINHYLHDVIGPVVMNSTHVGMWHESPSPTNEGNLDLIANDTGGLCPASDLGNSMLAVGVFRPNAAPSDYYLLITNKSLSQVTSTITLRQSWTITQSPGVVDYVGGTDYSPVGTGTSFQVTLQGGEGRLYRLTPSPTQDIALLSPTGAVTWRPAQSLTVTWQSNSQPVDLLLYTDPHEDAPYLTGPSVTLASGLTGGSASVTMPSVISHHARLVLQSTGTDGVLRSMTSGPIDATPVPDPLQQGSDLGDPHGYLQAASTIAPDGLPAVTYRNYDGSTWYSHYTGADWPASGITGPGIDFGIHSALVFDAVQNPNIVMMDGVNQYNATLDQWVRINGTWHTNTIATLNSVSGDCALTAIPGGGLYVAYNSGSAGGKTLQLARFGTDWQPYGPSLPGTDPSSISLAVAPDGSVWIAFAETPTALSGLRVLHVTQTTVTTSMHQVGTFPCVSLALDATGNPRVAYAMRPDPGDVGDVLLYREYNGTSWSPTKVVDNSAGGIGGVSLSTYGGTAHIAYVGNGALKYAEPSGSQWTIKSSALGYECDGPVQLSFTPSGTRWISFFDRSNDMLQFTTPDTDSLVCKNCGGCNGCLSPAISFRIPNPLVRGVDMVVGVRLAQAASIQMALYDVSGRRVATYGARALQPGVHELRWRPEGVRAGVYFLRARVAGGDKLADHVVVLL